MDFEVHLRKPAPDVHVVVVRGDLDIDTAPALRKFLDVLLDEGCRKLVVDFAEAWYIDSTGLALLMNTWSRLAERSGRLAVVCAVPRIRKVFQIVNLGDVIPLVDDEKAALEILAAS